MVVSLQKVTRNSVVSLNSPRMRHLLVWLIMQQLKLPTVVSLFMSILSSVRISTLVLTKQLQSHSSVLMVTLCLMARLRFLPSVLPQVISLLSTRLLMSTLVDRLSSTLTSLSLQVLLVTQTLLARLTLQVQL